MPCNKVLAWTAALLLAGCGVMPSDRPADAPVPTPVAIDPAIGVDFQEALGAMQAGNREDAERLFKAMAARYPELAGPLVNLGILYYQGGNLEQAEQALRRAVELNPAQAVAHNLLGVLHREQGRFREAVLAYEEALRIQPDYANAHLNLGILYDLYLLDATRGLQHYERYQQLTPEEDRDVKLWIIDLKNRSRLTDNNIKEDRP